MAVATGVDPFFRLSSELWGPEDVSHTGGEGFTQHAVIGGRRGGALTVLPVDNLAVAAASTIRWTDATSVREAAIRAVGWIGLRTGLAKPLLRNRISIRTHGGENQSLHEYLADALGAPKVELACAFGSERPNQKPVVRIFSTAGETLGFAKVGWNELTRKLVETETDFLTKMADKRLDTMLIARPIHNGVWNGRSLAVASPLLGSPITGRTQSPGVAVLQDLASLSDRYRQPIGGSAYRHALSERATSLPSSSPFHAAASLVDRRWADVDIEFGHWHGDWAPWNVRRRHDRYIVWDWERNGPGVPVGFDAIHFAFQPRFSWVSDPMSALLGSIEAVRPQLRSLGVSEEAEVPLAVMYLAELFLRFSDAGEDQPPAAGHQVEAVGELLAEAVRHFGS